MERISMDEFLRVDMRVGQVLEAERVSGSRKLVKMLVDIGDERRQVVAGIGDRYAPESLINKKLIVVANLEPKKLMGVESNGMIVAASANEGAVLATFVEDVPNGAKLK